MSIPARTEMRCIRCGGFSSVRICWHCSNAPDAVSYLLDDDIRKDAARYRRQFDDNGVWDFDPSWLSGTKSDVDSMIDEWIAEAKP